MFQQAANDKYFKRLINNFLQKLNVATKTRRHKGKCVAFFYPVCRQAGSCLCAFVANPFLSEAEKSLIVICKELKTFL